ncbi:hypothetical protein HW555_011192 [Spodoptera exigua]|uniref:Uncharacterized protein n=1 Tax=Spodoptera exigua TaxID=7107 RepID=A0A835G7I3_SPOEX|nr:hypothetical protein HW555_011192 [Spodoptera exigua]
MEVTKGTYSGPCKFSADLSSHHAQFSPDVSARFFKSILATHYQPYMLITLNDALNTMGTDDRALLTPLCRNNAVVRRSRARYDIFPLLEQS